MLNGKFIVLKKNCSFSAEDVVCVHATLPSVNVPWAIVLGRVSSM